MQNKNTFCIFHIFVLISLGVTIFYLQYINLSSDTIILFLSNKLFLGNWIRQGVFPLYNPYIYTGTPFAFDPGLGNLHPLNLLFLLPYPLSFALWAGAITFIYLIGFYLFFLQFTANKSLAALVALILIFSGSGFWRLNNPTIYIVIAHYGLFLFFLKNLKESNNWRNLAVPLFTGFLMTLSGHFQFVIYGYVLGMIIGLFFYHLPLRRLLLFYFLLFLSISWYLILSLPVVVESTRITFNADYSKTGVINLVQFFLLFFPFILGDIRSGASWNSGPTGVILISITVSLSFLYLLVKGKIRPTLITVLAFSILLSIGLLRIPFLRGAGQIFVIIHILVLTIIASEMKKLKNKFFNLSTNYLVILVGILSIVILFFKSSIFYNAFNLLYIFVKKNQTNLFFDYPTIQAIGGLIAKSLFLYILLLALLMFLKLFSRHWLAIFYIFILIEGIFINYYHNYFIHNNILTQPIMLPTSIDAKNYRIVTASDVVPYFGFHTYMSDVLIRPPFSKEKPIFDYNEQQGFHYLKTIFTYLPSSWAMTQNIKVIQAFNTFVPKKLADYFSKPSPDYEKEYADIIRRNPLFRTNDKGTQINAIETSRITLADLRWSRLAVRYYISDRPLSRYKLLARDHRYFYEDMKAEPIYNIEIGKSLRLFVPQKEDPNRVVFRIPKEYIGGRAILKINPAGFIVNLNNKKVEVIKTDFQLEIPLKSTGQLEIIYSPIEHLREIVTSAG